MTSKGLAALAAVLAMAIGLPALAGNGWPLRNGDFSRDETSHVQRPDWQVSFPSGQHTMVRQELTARPYSPAVLTIRSPVAGRAVLFQDVQLLPGDYTFRVRISTSPDALAVLHVSGKEQSYSGAAEADVAVDFSVSELQSVRAHILSVQTGEVRLRDARVDVRQLRSAAVPLEDGRQLGAIVIPDDATEAEQYAAWELQRFICRLTGALPGVAGRDPVAAGVRLRIGRAVGADVLARLAGRAPDSYLIAVAGDDILLAGNNDRGTLYAAYDWLKLQGCGWSMPGPVGEVVPRRAALHCISEERIESPDWEVRGLMKHPPEWDPEDVWRQWNADDIIDWAVRNRMNAFWGSFAQTLDFGPWRGGALIIRTNHSWASFWMEEGKPVKAEWAPLVAGQRRPSHPSGRPNQPCTSNPELRERTVARILGFFRENPQTVVFGLNADDEPADWCECANCRAQDADRGAGAWRTSADGMPVLSTTDRALSYVNAVAERVARVFPDKRIEMYAYASTRQPPERERVGPNVLIKYCLWPGQVPFGISARDRSLPGVADLGVTLDGWKQAGAMNFGLYDYGNFRYPDTAQLWLFHLCDSLLALHDTWGFRHCLGENDSTFAPSHMAYNLRARALWCRTIDYRVVIREVCDGYYGPAAPAMGEYYLLMDAAIRRYWQEHGDRYRAQKLAPYFPLELQEFQFPTMAAGQELLDRAWAAVGDDAAVRARLAPVRFGHALSTYTMAMTAESAPRQLAPEDIKQARAGWDLARALRQEYRIMVAQATTGHLKAFRVAPPIQDVVFALPVQWRFKRDPGDQGLTENWQRAVADDSWAEIRTDAAWTQQGHEYHGVAWYRLEFTLPEAACAMLARAVQATPALGFVKPTPVLYFGAVDGDADIFLDGEKIGEQKEPPEVMWDQAFTVALPVAFAANTPHTLVIRVRKDSQAAGIWRPVRVAMRGG